MSDFREEIDSFVQRRLPDILADLGELVRIPSIAAPNGRYPYGEECARALDVALRLAAEKGMRIQNRGYRYGTATFGDGDRTIGIFSHLDVVEPGDGWLYPPFECTEKNGFLIGRGVGDDKLGVVIGIYTALAMQEIKVAPHSRLMVYFGCAEETGMSDISYYADREDQPDFSLVPDIKFPVCIGERGVVKVAVEAPCLLESDLEIDGGQPSAKMVYTATASVPAGIGAAKNMLREAERRKDISTAEAQGRLVVTAHGWTPQKGDPRRGVNANHVLFGFLAECGAFSGADARILRQCADLMRSPGGSGLGVYCADQVSGEILCNCVRAETRERKLSLRFDLRCPVTSSASDILKTIEKTAAGIGWMVSLETVSDGWYIPEKDPRIALLCDAWENVSGVKAEPYVNSGRTYASKLNDAVGFGPMDLRTCPFLPTGHGSIHAPDEARSIETIRDAFRTYLRAVDALDTYYWECQAQN